MEIEKLTQAIKDIVIGELKQEFKEFRTEVRGELAGYRLAIESLSERMKNIENDIRDVRREIVEINKRIDGTNIRIDGINERIEGTNIRIDGINERIEGTNIRIDGLRDSLSTRMDDVYMEVSEIKGDLKKALADKVVIDDMILRIERLEEKVVV